MDSVVSLIDDIIPITEFNKGRAGKIFDSVKRSSRPKIVFKNNAPECVLLSPECYKALMDELEDIRLLALADKRLSSFDSSKLISAEDVNKKYGFNADDDTAEEVEFE